MNESSSLRGMIVEKAGDLFRSQGYMATSIKQIAKAAGCIIPDYCMKHIVHGWIR